jgi:hypothetical protein
MGSLEKDIGFFIQETLLFQPDQIQSLYSIIQGMDGEWEVGITHALLEKLQACYSVPIIARGNIVGVLFCGGSLFTRCDGRSTRKTR